MDTSIVEFHKHYYLPAIQKLALQFTHLNIIVTCHCGNTCREVFKHCAACQDVLYHRNHAERVVASFLRQIKSEYYGGNISVYIEGGAVEHFSAIDQLTSS